MLLIWLKWIQVFFTGHRSVGNDEDGEQIIRNLKQYNINTELVKQDANIGTSFSDVMIRRVPVPVPFPLQGTNRLLDMEHFDFEKIEADLLHIGYALLDSLDASDPEYGVVMARLDKAQKGSENITDVVMKTATGTPDCSSAKYCNYLL